MVAWLSRYGERMVRLLELDCVFLRRLGHWAGAAFGRRRWPSRLPPCIPPGLWPARPLQSVLIERVFAMVLALLGLALSTSPVLAALTGDRGPIWISGALFVVGIAGFVFLLSPPTGRRSPSPTSNLVLSPTRPSLRGAC